MSKRRDNESIEYDSKPIYDPDLHHTVGSLVPTPTAFFTAQNLVHPSKPTTYSH